MHTRKVHCIQSPFIKACPDKFNYMVSHNLVWRPGDSIHNDRFREIDPCHRPHMRSRATLDFNIYFRVRRDLSNKIEKKYFCCCSNNFIAINSRWTGKLFFLAHCACPRLRSASSRPLSTCAIQDQVSYACAVFLRSSFFTESLFQFQKK